MSDDLDLRQRFHELREEEQQATPVFTTPASRPAFLVRRWAPLAAAALLIIISSVVFTMRPRRVSFSVEDRIAAEAVAQWQPQTDFLLRTPGSELLTSTPSIPDDATRSVVPSIKGDSR